MKREILFRGKNRLKIWFYGGLFTNKEVNSTYILTGEGMKDKVKGDTISQFIGRTDKHGAKIFEGDYLADRYTEDGIEYITKLPVIWDNEKLCWSVDTSFAGDGSHSQPIASFFGDTELEVIGNIWDNPEKHDEKP